MKIYYNRDTGEVFESKRAAMLDAREQYDFGDSTNFVTYLGFPNDVLPYIELDRKQYDALAAAFC